MGCGLSHVALQRVMVRMLFDPEYARRVLSQPQSALAGEMLTDQERSWLLRPDPRAWRADPERPLRSLDVLLREFPTSASLAVRASGGPEALREYFSSELFHRVIRERGSMALGFGQHLVRLVESGRVADRRVIPLARLETAIARIRRRSYAGRPPAILGEELPPVSPILSAEARGGSVRLSPDKALHTAEAGCADLRDAILQQIGAIGQPAAGAVLDPDSPLPDLQVDPSRGEPLLLEILPDDGPSVKAQVGIAEITPELYSILAFACEPRSVREIVAEVRRLGATDADAPEIVDGLIEEGVLVGARRPP